MRTKTKIIDGKSETFVWLNIKSQWFTLQNETILLRFVNLHYYALNEREQIINDFRKLCEVYL